MTPNMDRHTFLRLAGVSVTGEATQPCRVFHKWWFTADVFLFRSHIVALEFFKIVFCCGFMSWRTNHSS